MLYDLESLPVLQNFKLLLICHSRARCGNLSFFYNSTCPPLLTCVADNAEAQVEVGVTGVVPALVAHLAVVGVVVPAAAAVIASAAVVGVAIPEILVQISAPFPHVSAHVIQSVAVRSFLCNGVCFFFAVVIIPGNFI